MCPHCVQLPNTTRHHITSLFVMESAAYRWYKDVTKEDVHVQSLEFCKSLKLDLTNELEINIDLNLNLNILINISKQVCT